MKEKNFDVVIFGATGYTGKLVVEYMVKNYLDDNELNWTIAGRSQEKLKSVKEAFGLADSINEIVVDSNDYESVQKMVSQSKCVLTTVGPYQLYGSNILRACAETGVDYVDLCGEPAWMHKMIQEYNEISKSSGARIIFSCGFDSIPFDLGVYLLQKKVIAHQNNPARNIRGRVRAMNGEFSGGTAASMTATMASLKKNPELIEILGNPFALSDGFQGPHQPNDSKPMFDEKLETWVSPFFMAPINSKNIHRSNTLLKHFYGKEFCYNEMWVQGPGESGKAAAQAIAGANPLENAPEPGDGPSKESRENGKSLC